MIEHLYSTPLYYAKVNDYESINYHIDKSIDLVKFKEGYGGSTWKITTNFTVDKEPTILKDLRLNKLIKQIDNHLKIYCSEINFDLRNGYKLHSWIAKCEPGDYVHVHQHASSDLSGVYYYKTNEKDGDIYFESPNPYLEVSKCYEARPWNHPPQVGKIIIFPGWLRHGVTHNKTDHTRISVGFNIYFNQ
tara:strand:- start:29 stop:598 length:570 start_codon:yes stop_codon:yes gene_type:complete